MATSWPGGRPPLIPYGVVRAAFAGARPIHSVRTAAPSEGPIHLGLLSFELPTLDDRPGPIRDFLIGFVGAEMPTQEAMANYLETVWPQGVPGTFLVSNVADDGVEHLRLLLRPPVTGPEAANFARKGSTLALSVYRRQGKFVVGGAEVTAHVIQRAFERVVTGPIYWNEPERFVSAEDFARLGALPYQRAQTRARLKPWGAYLDWKEKLVHANQTRIAYAAWRWEDDTRVAFLVEAGDLDIGRSVIGLELGAAPPEVEAKENENARFNAPKKIRPPKLIELGEVETVEPIDPDRDEDSQKWRGIQVNRNHRRVIFRLDESDAKALRKTEGALPSPGQLMASIAGDLGPLINQRHGIERLTNGQGFCPNISDFLFSSDSAGASANELPPLPEIEEGRRLNDGQREAVQKALAAPDLCLIQGPPGTGKTTVIADICLRAALMGQRVLVASQTNLAVDNALARLTDQTVVRRLRLGDPSRVDDEFKEFLADNVITQWFAGMAEQCKRRVGDARATDDQVSALRQAVATLANIAKTYEAGAEYLVGARQSAQQAEHALAHARADSKRLAAAAASAEVAANAWKGLLAWAQGAGALPEDLAILGQVADTATVHRVAATIETQPDLEALRQAIGGLLRADSGMAPPELAELRREKLRLSDAEDQASLLRLGEVNVSLRRLERATWNRATGAVDRAARAALGEPTPGLVRLVDALKPDAELLALAEAERKQVEQRLAEVEVHRQQRAGWAAAWEAYPVAAAQARASVGREQEEARAREAQARTHAEALEVRVDRAAAAQAALRTRWVSTWLSLGGEAPPEPSAAAVAAIQSQVEAQVAESSTDLARARRWMPIQEEWADRLRRISQSDREQLQALYVRHANVVGMTCNEAGKRNTWNDQSFKPFDIVIVDEVSKATPPELILPMLLGRKVVLVGDHRQLPPMFREREGSFGEAVAEGAISHEDFVAFRRMVTASLFEELFDAAPDAIKATLRVQYRMHPQIMDAVNQFYDGQLEAGPDRGTLAQARHHRLSVPDRRGGHLVEPGQHLLWVDSSLDRQGQPAWEEQAGSSKRNPLEVELVAKTVVRVGRALRDLGFFGEKTLVVGRHGPLGETLADLLPEVPEETLEELFAERRVRMDGRARGPTYVVQAGEMVLVQAQREVGVLTFYGAQLKALRSMLDEARREVPEAFLGMDLRTNTVDRFQGMEKAIIVMSLVRSKKGKLGDFVREFQRINVGISRAQKLLVIVGAVDTWSQAQVALPPMSGGAAIERPVYANILDGARQSGGRRVARQLLD